MMNEYIDNNLALKLLKEGGVFILLDLPPGSEFGIDMKVWNVDYKFKGIKMIPPGPHFIYYSAKNIHGDTAPRSGFIYVFKKGEVVIRKWDASTEDISAEEVNEEQKKRHKENLLQLDTFLGPYPYDTWEKWKSLTKHINENVVQKLIPKSGYIRSAVDLVHVEKKINCRTKQRWSKSRTEEERQEDLLPEMVPVFGTEIRFTEMPTQRYPVGASPTEISSHYLDCSYTLTKMLSTYTTPLDFIGEIEFAFVCFLICLNFEAFEQWKKLVQLMCSCMKAITRFTLMYTEFITSLEVQLEEIPVDFLVDIVADNNIVYRSLRDFFANINLLKTEPVNRLYRKAEKFKAQLTSKFGWDFTNLEVEEDDEAPVVVVL